MPEGGLKPGWEGRLRADRERAARIQSPALRAITAEVLRRAVRAGALAVALTGSTARARRTAISDIDYHVVGPRPDLDGLPGEVDVVADAPERFQRRLADGDDFVQWTLRYGCVLHDPRGVMYAARERIANEDLWPDPRPKLDRAQALGHLAERVLEIEDRDAAQEHVRAALTSMARGVLLAGRTFPLARDELADQLRVAQREELAEWLQRSIHERLSLDELRLVHAALLAVDRLATRRPGAGEAATAL